MSHDMGGMKMYFHFGYTEDNILFSFWKISSIGGTNCSFLNQHLFNRHDHNLMIFLGLIGSMIGIFLLAMLYEGLKVLREYLLHRSMHFDETGISRQSGSSASSNGLRVPLAAEGDSVQDSQNVVVIKSFFRYEIHSEQSIKTKSYCVRK